LLRNSRGKSSIASVTSNDAQTALPFGRLQ
jgi:hypothetical protein